MTTQEKWVPVVGFETSHKVSDSGRIASIDRGGKKGRELKHDYTRGHASIYLCMQGERKRFSVSRLVAESFLRPLKPDEIVYPRDGNGKNVCAENLVIVKHDDVRDAFAALSKTPSYLNMKEAAKLLFNNVVRCAEDVK